MICPFSGFFLNLMGKANVVEIPFQDCAILPQTVSPTFKAEAKVVRNDLLFPERQAIKCLIEFVRLVAITTVKR